MPVTAKDIFFSYGGREVLSGVSFEAKPNETLAVLGSNGAGKSTLFSCLLGLRRFSGEAYIDGQDVSKLKAKELSRVAAYVPQSHAPTFNYSVLDMALMGTASRSLFRPPGKREAFDALSALERVGIGHLSSQGYLNISGGERQLTLIARALAQNAKTLIMDEPTANLDYGNWFKVLSCARGLAQDGHTVIFSTHNPDHAFMFADNVLALKGGKVEAFGPPGEVLTAELVESLYSIKVRVYEGYGGLRHFEPMLDP